MQTIAPTTACRLVVVASTPMAAPAQCERPQATERRP
jgi:hypothetical protein